MKREFTGKTDSYGNKLYVGDKVRIEGYRKPEEEFKICKSSLRSHYKEKYWMDGWACLGIDGFKRNYEQFKIRKVQPIKTSNVETYTYEALPYLVNFKITDKNKNITYDTVNSKDFSCKIIINDTTTVVIFNDGSKGISKCSSKDMYDRDKGIDIAYQRALIKFHQKELDKLTK